MSKAAELKRLYNKHKKRKYLFILSFFVALIVIAIISVSLGAGSPRVSTVFQVLSGKLFPFFTLYPGSDTDQIIIMFLRLPRIILAVIAGAGLAASGATMQGILRNPLTSPYILGISSAAAFGASLAIVFGIGIITSGPTRYIVIVNAFAFSLLAMLLVYGIARISGMRTETVILSGVAVGYLFSALVSLIQYVAPNYEALKSVVFWLMGGLGTATWSSISIVLPVVLITTVLMMTQAWNINVMSMGEDVATSSGVNPKRVLSASIILVTLQTATIISFTGVIGFVCLIGPHISRMLIGSDHRFLIPCSAIVGAFILLASDTVGRLIISPDELPVGIVTSLLGVPFFIYMLARRRRTTWR
jgi:iron complex transport system permease protein